MACKPVVFSGITRERFEAMCARIENQAKVQVLGDTGKASGQGFTVTWTYDEPNQVLTVQCTDKPFLVPESLVDGKIRDMVNAQ